MSKLDFHLNFLQVLLLYLIALATTFVNHVVGLAAFICVTIFFVTFILSLALHEKWKHDVENVARDR